MRQIVLTFLTVLFMILALPIHNQAETLSKPPEGSTEELYHDLFITLLSPHIDEPVNTYYSKLLTENPIVYNYMIDIIRAKRVHGNRSFGFKVTLEVTPVVGPHISVGKDVMTFDISPGKVKLLMYEHVETHELPPHWQHIVK